MQRKLYVGNLSYSVSEEDLRTLFAKHGTVETVTIIRDSYSGQSKGFAFVEMASGEEAEKALAETGQDFMGRNIVVSEARPKKSDDGFRKGGGGGGKKGKFGRDRGFGKRRDY